LSLESLEGKIIKAEALFAGWGELVGCSQGLTEAYILEVSVSQQL